MRASSLIGLGLESEGGKRLGTLTELAVQPASGNIPFAVVRLKDDPRRLRAAPLDAFRMSVWRDGLLLVPEAEALAASPAFTAAQLEARLGDPSFVQRQAALADALTPAGTAAAGGSSDTRLFARLDADDDGTLSERELNATRADLRSWMALDADRDGRISRAEFTALRD